jgi:uncharacterized protein YbbC (DUF1343 family)
VRDREKFEPVISGVSVVKVIHDLYGDQFRWKDAPYEYVFDKNPFDVISGTDKLRRAIEGGDSVEKIEDSWAAGLREFKQARDKYLLY